MSAFDPPRTSRPRFFCDAQLLPFHVVGCGSLRLMGRPMKRRDFITLAGTAAIWPLAARTQGVNRPRVGYLFTSRKAEGQGLWEACRQGLRELGYREGENITLEPRWTEGDQERLPDLVKELLGLNMTVLVTAATPASLAAKAATNTTPIVFVGVADPVSIGLVTSLARPGGNVTGLSLLTSELSGKRLRVTQGNRSQRLPRGDPDEP